MLVGGKGGRVLIKATLVIYTVKPGISKFKTHLAGQCRIEA